MKQNCQWAVRLFVEADRDECAQCFYNEKWLKVCCMDDSPRWQQDQIQKYLSATETVRLVSVERSGEIVGFCRYFPDGNCSMQYEGGVLPEMIDSGLGVFLAVLSAKHVFRQHPEVMTLNGFIKPNNRHSIRLHEKMGFSRQVGPYDNRVWKYTVTRQEYTGNGFVHRVLKRICVCHGQ